MKQKDIVSAIDRDAGWVSRILRGPGNWTLRTIGELVEALNGEIEIIVHAREDRPERPANYSAYVGYTVPPIAAIEGVHRGQILGPIPAGFPARAAPPQ